MNKFKRKTNEERDAIIPLTEQQLTYLNNLYGSKQIQPEKTKPKPKCLCAWKRFALVATLIVAILVPSITLPLTLKNPQTRFYADTNLSQTTLEQSYIENVFDNQFPQYNFIFEDCTLSSIYGYFTPDKHSKLLAITLKFSRIDDPFTNGSINLTISNNFSFSNHEEYIKNANITETSTYTLYMKKQGISFNQSVKFLIIHSKYKIYVNFDRQDNIFFEKFL